MPPKNMESRSKSKSKSRMSDLLHSSSIDTQQPVSAAQDVPPTNTFSAPHSSESEGPTLPIVGGEGIQNQDGEGDGIELVDAEKSARKRKRTTSEHRGVKSASKAQKMQGEKAGKAEREERRTNTNHPSLYTPWTLLPTRERKAINLGINTSVGHGVEENTSKASDSEGKIKANVEVLVYSRNQNVKAGIKRLRGLLCDSGNASGETVGREALDTQTSRAKDILRDEERVIAISAQGEGTVKLVGVVDMVRRLITEERKRKSEDGGVDGGIEKVGTKEGKWFVYTTLSSVEIPLRKGREGRDGASNVVGDVDEDALEDGKEGGREGAEEGREEEESGAMDVDVNCEDPSNPLKLFQQKRKTKTKTTPVLTIWFSRQPLQGWKAVFGEDILTVSNSDAKK